MKATFDRNALGGEDRAALSLKSLYRSYGYSEYKLSGFEDYSLYAENASFLDGNGVLTFNSGGRLLALRPDVTLSVVKNIADDCESHKLFYDERVYRKSAVHGEQTELRQIGVEVIGEIDEITQAEVCELIMRTLECVAQDRLLDISHAGIVNKIANGAGFFGDVRARAAAFLSSKNSHDFLRFAQSVGANETFANAFLTLITLPQKPSDAIAVLQEVAKSIDISAEVAELKAIADACGERSNIDFSVGGNPEYYNGAVFKGYVRGVPYAVLSGGRYDKLLHKFGKNKEALGFALYLGELGEYFAEKPKRPDAAVVYDERGARRAAKKAAELRASGLDVLLCKTAPEGCGAVYICTGEEND